MRRTSYLAAVVSLTALVACGGNKPAEVTLQPSELIAAAAGKTIAAGSSKMVMTIDMGALKMTAEGAFDYVAGAGRITMDGSALMPGLGSIEMIALDKVIYMKLAGIPGVDPAKPWIKLDLATLGKQAGVDIEALTEMGSNNDPTASLQYLRGASDDITEVGKDTVRGVPATHYKGTIDMAKAAAQVPEQYRDAFEKARSKVGLTAIPMDVWVDAEGRAVKMVMVANSPAKGAAPATAGTITVELFDFGAKVDAAAPPAGQVTDFADLMKGMGG